MRFIYTLSIVFLIILGGCQKKKNDDFVSDSLKDIVVPQKTNTSNSKTSFNHNQPSGQTITPVNAPKVPPIGIKVNKNQIIIDTNQTRRFLESLTRKIDQSFNKVANDLKNNKVSSPNETGVIITQDRIEIDLNKTQKFMEKWIRSMEAVGKQLDSVAKELDRSFNP